MAKFTAQQPLNIEWHGNVLIGSSTTTYRIPDALKDEFDAGLAAVIPGGVTWVDEDELADVLPLSGGAITGALSVGGAISGASLSATGNIFGSNLTVDSAGFKGRPWYDVKAYGALGDGTTDDSTAIQAAIDAATTAGAGIIFMPPGTYKLATTLTLVDSLVLQGSGEELTTLLSPPLDTAISVTGTSADPIDNLVLLNFGILNGSSGTGSQVLLDLQWVTQNVVLSRLKLHGGSHNCEGLRLQDSWDALLDRIYFVGFPGTLPALELRSTGSVSSGLGSPMNNIAIRSCRWQDVMVGVEIQNTADTSPGLVNSVVFDNPRFKRGTQSTSVGIRGNSNQIIDVTIRDGHFEDIHDAIIIKGSEWKVDGALFSDVGGTCVDVETSLGNCVIDRLNLQGTIGTMVKLASTITQDVRVLGYTIASGSTCSTPIDNQAGLFGAPAAICPEYGASHVGNVVIGAADRCIFAPIDVTQSVKVNGVHYVIGTSSGSVAVALYDAAGNRLATSGEVACPTAGRTSTLFTSAAYIPPGRYYLAISASDNTATFGCSVESGLVSIGLARYESSAHPPPSTASFTGITGTAVILAALVAGTYL